MLSSEIGKSVERSEDRYGFGLREGVHFAEDKGHTASLLVEKRVDRYSGDSQVKARPVTGPYVIRKKE